MTSHGQHSSTQSSNTPALGMINKHYPALSPGYQKTKGIGCLPRKSNTRTSHGGARVWGACCQQRLGKYLPRYGSTQEAINELELSRYAMDGFEERSRLRCSCVEGFRASIKSMVLLRRVAVLY